MCLIVFAWRAHADYRLIVAANRDEFHARPAQEADWWPDQPTVLAGRDLQAGGTWLAVGRAGRFATVTNYREQQKPCRGLRSRGEIVTDFVTGDSSALEFVASIEADRYAGVSILACDGEVLAYASNRGDEPRALAAGIYGLSNAALDTPWPKLVRSRDALADLIESGQVDESQLMRVLNDRTPQRSSEIDAGKLPFELAQALTAPFIVADEYGTRCSTAVLVSNAGDVDFWERRFDAQGEAAGDSRFSFRLDSGNDKPAAASS